MEQRQDDGSLSFLGIEPDENNKHFNCPETNQQKLINLSFWVFDYLDDVNSANAGLAYANTNNTASNTNTNIGSQLC